MAYKQKGCTPITAKLQKTTKGGMVQQPLLNMGAPVKMKMTSPAKQGGEYNKRKRRVVKQDAAEFSKKRDSDIQRLTSEINAMQGAISSYESKSGGKAPESDYNYLNKSKAKLKDIKVSAAGEAARRQVTKEIRAQFDKNTATGKDGWDAYDESRKNKVTKKVPAAGKDGWDAYDESRKNKTKLNKKGTDNPPKVTGKIGSDLRRQQYDKLGWKYDDTIKRKKVEAIKPNTKAKTVSIETKSEPVGSIVLPNKPVQVKNVEKAVKKIDVAENKETRAAKVRAKGEKALAEGNKGKALRLKRREERISNRAQKKKSQASKAIGLN